MITFIAILFMFIAGSYLCHLLRQRMLGKRQVPLYISIGLFILIYFLTYMVGLVVGQLIFSATVLAFKLAYVALLVGLALMAGIGIYSSVTGKALFKFKRRNKSGNSVQEADVVEVDDYKTK